jgi:hypothetical protein
MLGLILCRVYLSTRATSSLSHSLHSRLVHPPGQPVPGGNDTLVAIAFSAAALEGVINESAAMAQQNINAFRGLAQWGLTAPVNIQVLCTIATSGPR